MGQISSSQTKIGNAPIEVDFSENDALITFEAVHVLDPDPTDPLLNFKTLKKIITEPLFKEKLDKIYDPNEWFFKRKLTLTWISKRKLGKVRLFVIHDSFADENIREFFDNVNEHHPNILAFFDKYATRVLDLGQADAPGVVNEDQYQIYVPEKITRRLVYNFFLDESDRLLGKAKIMFISDDELKQEANSQGDRLMAQTMVEREEREARLADALTEKNIGPNILSMLYEPAMKKALSELQHIPKAPIQYWIANDDTPLSYRAYCPSERETVRACIVMIAINSLFHDILAWKISRHYPICVYIAEIRGFGYSGGPRGDANSKEVVWSDIRSFVRMARYSHAEGVLVFLAGFIMTGGLILNYSAWKDRDPVDGYMFFSPSFGYLSFHDTMKKEVIEKNSKTHAFKSHRGNIAMSKWTHGRVKGNDVAVELSFPEELYLLNTMTVDHYSTNILFAITPTNPKSIFEHMQEPIFFVIGSEDEMFQVDNLLKYPSMSKNSLNYIAVVEGLTQTTLLAETNQLAGDWVNSLLELKSRSGSHKTTPSSVSESTLISLASNTQPSKNITDSIQSMSISSSSDLDSNKTQFNQELSQLMIGFLKCRDAYPKANYLESFDGQPISYRVYYPSTQPVAVVVFWLDVFKEYKMSDMSETLSVILYCFDVRQSNENESKVRSIQKKSVLWRDIRTSIHFAKRNHGGLVLFLGGHGATGALVLNYATWHKAEPPHAYMFISPLPNPFSSTNHPILTEFGKTVLQKEKMVGGNTGLLFLGKQSKKVVLYIDPVLKALSSEYSLQCSEVYLKSLLSTDILAQVICVSIPFIILYGEKDQVVKSRLLLDSVCSLTMAPMHSLQLISNVGLFTTLDRISDSIKPWLTRIVSSLNPTPTINQITQAKLDDFERLDILGKGTFGIVWLVRHLEADKYLAMKVLRKVDIVRNDLVHQVIRERDLLSSMRSPFIVPYAGCFQDTRCVYLLMEFLVGGELYTQLRLHVKFPLDWIRFYAGEVIVALQFLHENGVIYRDLKPENILLDALGHVRLIDFGLGRKLEPGQTTKTFCGSPFYMAPEMILSKSYNMSVDVWAFGVLLYELLVGNVPFNGRSPAAIYRKILFGKVDWQPAFPPDLKDLITKCLDPNPTKRVEFWMGSNVVGSQPTPNPSNVPAVTVVSSSTTMSPSLSITKNKLSSMASENATTSTPNPPTTTNPNAGNEMSNPSASVELASVQSSSGSSFDHFSSYSTLSSLPSPGFSHTIYSDKLPPIFRHKFFKGVDWRQVASRLTTPPFQPTVHSDSDTSNFVTFGIDPSENIIEQIRPLDTTKGDPFIHF